ncbi:MAG: TatD family hydrolase [Bacteroidales bacterium]|nr:TatD family hydrolase [Bacteroidales bacterium]
MEYIDTHCHYCDEAFREDASQVIARAEEAGVKMMLQADVDSHERAGMYALCEAHRGVLCPMLGLYPGSVDENWRDEMDEMLRWRDRGAVAIGEIGLDYHYGAEYAAQQKEAFRLQLELAAQMSLPVNIHLRDATEDFFRVMEDCRHLGLRGNLHAFSGSVETFRRMERYGDWYVGIGGVVTFKKASLAETVRHIPLEKILLETDAPYLTPVPHRGERNDSSFIPLIAAKVAELKGIGIEEVAAVTSSNARSLFSLPE